MYDERKFKCSNAMVFDLWETSKKSSQPYAFSSIKKLIFQDDLDKADEKTIVARFETFLRIELLEKANQVGCQPGAMTNDRILSIFLVQCGWESYSGGSEGERYDFVYQDE